MDIPAWKGLATLLMVKVHKDPGVGPTWGDFAEPSSTEARALSTESTYVSPVHILKTSSILPESGVDRPRYTLRL